MSIQTGFIGNQRKLLISAPPASLLVLFVFVFGNSPSLGNISACEEAHVPVGRLVKNLRAQEVEKPALETENEFKMGRLYSISYAQNDTSLPVRKHKYTQLITEDDVIYPNWVQEHWPRYRQFTMNTTEKNIEAKDALKLSIEHYQRALTLIEKNSTDKPLKGPSEFIRRLMGSDLVKEDIKLGLGWCLEQAGEIDEAKKLYREVIKSSQEYPNPGHGSFGQERAQDQTADGRRAYEAAIYLKPLLDSNYDKVELDQLSKLPAPDYKVRLNSPIVIPLASHLVPHELMQDANVAFDLGYGLRHYSSWPSPRAGWLVYCKKKSSEIKTGSQLFGNHTFSLKWRNGYEALASLDDNHDGNISGVELENLAVWQDYDYDGKSNLAEIHSLSELGVKSLSCSAQEDSDHILSSEKGITFGNGETRRTYDFVLKELPEQAVPSRR